MREFLHVDDLAEACIYLLENWDPALESSPKDNRGNSLNHLNIGSGKEISITVGMDTARKEGWTSNPKYKTMPEQMLRYRSATWLIRTHCPEVLLGMQSSEEIQDVQVNVPVGGSPVDKINQKVKEKINITEEANKLDDTNTKLENVISDSIEELDNDDPFN